MYILKQIQDHSHYTNTFLHFNDLSKKKHYVYLSTEVPFHLSST